MFPTHIPHLIVDDSSTYVLEPCQAYHSKSLFAMVKTRFDDINCTLDLDGADQDLRDFEKHWRERGGEFMVLTHQGNVIASLCIRPSQDRPAGADLNWFFIRREYEGKGLTLILFKWAYQWCQEHNIRFLELWTNEKRHPAHKIYRSLGFKHNGVKRLYHTNPDQYLLYFEMEINDQIQKQFERFLSKI